MELPLAHPNRLVEAVHRGQVFVAVTKMILAKMPRAVAGLFEDLGETRGPRLQPELVSGNADGLGKRFRRRSPGDTETSLRAIDSTTSRYEMIADVTP
jgi:hypothetical protein